MHTLEACLTKPYNTTNGANDLNEEIAEPYTPILDFFSESTFRGDSRQEIRTC